MNAPRLRLSFRVLAAVSLASIADLLSRGAVSEVSAEVPLAQLYPLSITEAAVQSAPTWAVITVPALSPAPLVVGELTLEACVQEALRANFDVRLEQLDRRSVREGEAIARAEFDPDFSAATRTTETVNQGAPISGGESANSVVTELGVDQRVISGGTVRVDAGIQRDNSVAAPLTRAGDYGATTSLRIVQPLLRGAGLARNRASRLRAEASTARAEADLRTLVLNVVRDTETAFYNLSFARSARGEAFLAQRAGALA
jgi:outer membrane protein